MARKKREGERGIVPFGADIEEWSVSQGEPIFSSFCQIQCGGKWGKEGPLKKEVNGALKIPDLL